MRRAVFLDRDGVINRTMVINGVPTPPKSVEDVEILEGVIEAIQILRSHDFLPIVVTNQPDVSRGLISDEDVNAINEHVAKSTNLKYFYNCFHDDMDFCACRKPLPGLIQRAALELDLNIPRSYLVGDRWRDIAAGQAAGCQTFFIDYSYPENLPLMPYVKVESLLHATNLITGGDYESS